MLCALAGAVAQLGERLVRNEEVRGSIPLGSTTPKPPRNRHLLPFAGVAAGRVSGPLVLQLVLLGPAPDASSYPLSVVRSLWARPPPSKPHHKGFKRMPAKSQNRRPSGPLCGRAGARKSVIGLDCGSVAIRRSRLPRGRGQAKRLDDRIDQSIRMQNYFSHRDLSLRSTARLTRATERHAHDLPGHRRLHYLFSFSVAREGGDWSGATFLFFCRDWIRGLPLSPLEPACCRQAGRHLGRADGG
jgi:hypothetical protein